jgi:hypothetical protein
MLLYFRRVGKQKECVQFHCGMICTRPVQLETTEGLSYIRRPHKKYIIFQHRSSPSDTNISPAIVRSIKHKHTNKNWTHNVQKWLFKLNDARLTEFKYKLSDRLCRYFIRSWNHINSIVLSVIYYVM